MFFSEIQPFVRYAHYLPLTEQTEYEKTIPCDARLFYTCHGNGVIWAADQVYDMPKGALMIIPSGVCYQILAPRREVSFLAVNFDYTQGHTDKNLPVPPMAVTAYRKAFCIESISFCDRTEFHNVVYRKNMFSLEELLLRLYREYTKKLIYADRIASDIMGEVLFRCARVGQNSDSAAENDAIIYEMIDFIHEHYGEPLSNRAVGERFCLHENYVSSLFKNYTGMSLHRYILHTRISASLEMIYANRYTVGEVAQKCGFSDIYHFSKTFKRLLGVSPSNYIAGGMHK